MANQAPPRALTAGEFFDLDLDGCSMQRAANATGISYSTVHDIRHGKGKVGPRVETLEKLAAWSRKAGDAFGVHISVAKTLGIEEPATPTTDAR